MALVTSSYASKNQVVRYWARGGHPRQVSANVLRLVDSARIVAFKGDRLGYPEGLRAHGLAPPFVPAW